MTDVNDVNDEEGKEASSVGQLTLQDRESSHCNIANHLQGFGGF